jgi:trimethylamine--corrinoid protein Co-methyltransferase
MGLFSGATGIGAQGIVGADQGISLEQLVLDNDWLDAYRHVLRGVSYDPDALRLIEEVGIAGNYMAHEHTVEHMRNVQWDAPSGAFWRDQWEPWRDRGAKDIYARAHAFVEDAARDADTMDPVIDANKAEMIDRIYHDTVRFVETK